MFLKKLVRVKKIDYICGNIQRTPKYTLKLQNTRFLCEYNAFKQDFILHGNQKLLLFTCFC